MVREWPQQYPVHNTENGCVCPNAERDRDYGHGCEAGVLDELAKGKS
jgi:hypothetical protein